MASKLGGLEVAWTFVETAGVPEDSDVVNTVCVEAER